MIKYSRQRESIKNFLMHRCDHPTAETIYLGIKEEFPNISLGTVYRNLSLLSEMGEITKISANGADRFDGNTFPHYHFFCNNCGKVFDLALEHTPELNSIANQNFDGRIERSVTHFFGTCSDCLKKEKII